MAPILYYLELSPPVRAVLLTAEAIGLKLELRDVNLLEKEHLKADFIKMNPQHTVPTLDDNGFIIWDSHAIAAYLVGKYAKDDSLYPKDLQKRAIVDQRLHFDSSILFPRMRNIFFPIFFLGCKEIPADKLETLQDAYEQTNNIIGSNEYFAGNQLTIADFCAIASLSSVVPVVPFESTKYPNIARWMKKMKTLPYYQQKNGNGAEAISTKANQALGK